MSRLATIVLSSILGTLGCATGADPTATPDAGPDGALTLGGDSETPAPADFTDECKEGLGLEFAPGLQVNGSVSFYRTLAGGARTHVALSAPILPNLSVLYAKTASGYPTSDAELRALAKEIALSFCFLIEDCAPDFPSIKTTTPLTEAELSTNYDEVATCGYQKYTAKPYWSPQLVDKGDVCGDVLGVGWRLPTQADVEGLSASELQLIQSTLTTASGSQFYYQLQMFARGADGKLRLADLSAGAASRMLPAGTPIETQSGNALRCFRTADVK
jgi:hypothetical protein